MKVVGIVPAAGAGTRLGMRVPKALVPVHGTPLLAHTVAGLLTSGSVESVVVAAPPQRVTEFAEVADAWEDRCSVVPGGPDRPISVRRALESLDAGTYDAVLVHDAARAFTPASVINDVVSCLASGARAVVPVLPVTDTVKLIDREGMIAATQDRTALRAVQTPQGFSEDVLRTAYATDEGEHSGASDDAGLVEHLGIGVHTVRGHEHAMKITTPFDLAVAEAVLAGGEPRP